jgi:hypothetical protein
VLFMCTTPPDEKESDSGTQTTQGSLSVRATIPSAMRYPGLSKAGPRKRFASGSERLRSDTDDSTWGLTKRLVFDRNRGYGYLPDPATSDSDDSA